MGGAAAAQHITTTNAIKTKKNQQKPTRTVTTFPNSAYPGNTVVGWSLGLKIDPKIVEFTPNTNASEWARIWSWVKGAEAAVGGEPAPPTYRVKNLAAGCLTYCGYKVPKDWGTGKVWGIPDGVPSDAGM